MKRDLDLVKSILLAIEADEEADGRKWVTLGRIDDYSPEQVHYHVGLLHEAGLVKALCIPDNLGPPRWQPERLTWYGHEFLDSARNETLWAEAKKQMKNMGNFSFQILSQILIDLAKREIT